MKAIRNLRADEIDVRVQSVKKEGYSVLLYKDARCDMKILDETFGSMNWQRSHEVVNNNLFCTVSIYDTEKKEWINKQDVGIPSYSQGEKGEASDSFKRACTNVGIGRELYTAPFIWIEAQDGEIKNVKGKNAVYTKLKVTFIDYNEDREITALEISDSKGNVKYQYQNKKQTKNKPNKEATNNNQNKQTYTGNNQNAEKEKIRKSIANICQVKHIDMNRVTEELKENYGTSQILDLNLNQMKMLEKKISAW